jgi:hypothetical protein
MRSVLSLLAAAVAALLLAGCGGGGEDGGASALTTGGESAASVLAAAASETSDSGSSRVDLTFSTELPPELAQEPVTFTGQGAFDYASRKGELTYDFSELFATLGLPQADEPVEAIFQGDVFFMKFPLLSASLPEGRPWLKLDLKALGQQPGVNLAQLQQLSQGDPSRALDYLRATGATVEEVGSEQIRGVETTHYHGTIQLDKLADQVPAEQREQVRATVQQLIEQTGMTEIPTDVWVGEDGLIRRMTLNYTAKVPASGSDPQEVASTVTMEFYDFGAEVDVQPPRADQVTDVAELTEPSSGSGGGTGS